MTELPDSARTARQFGRDQLGPIFAEYLTRLDQAIRYFTSERDAKVLFVSRAGVRIRRLYEQYLTATGKDVPDGMDYLWTSRFMTMKGTWSTQSIAVSEALSKEFASTTLAELVASLLRGSDQIVGLGQGARELALPARHFREFIWGGSDAAHYCRWHLTEQSDFFSEYIDDLVGERRTVLLIDSGWQGTSQTLLSDWRPELEWWGAYFGRIGTTESDRRYWDRMIGLMFEADSPDSKDPATAVIGHRHLIEDALEPRGPSVERLARDRQGAIFAPQAHYVLQATVVENRDAVYLGIGDYIAELTPDAAPAKTFVSARAAWPEVARTLLFPTAQDAESLAGSTRSADYGRSLTVPLTFPSVDRHQWDSAETRVRDAIWPAAQIALEYPPHLAQTRQAQLWGFSLKDAWVPSDEVLTAPKPEAAGEGEWAGVAVITRTTDRVVFLERAIRSVAEQTYKDLVHVIVCDGGDIDRVRAAIEASAADLRRTILIDNVRNRGMEAASNIAIAHSESEFIVIHDDDDTWEPTFLEKAVAALRAPRGAALGGVICNSWYVSEEVLPDGITVHSRVPYRGEIKNVQLMEMAVGNFFPPIAFVFRRAWYDEIGGFDDTLAMLGDWDFNLRLLMRTDVGVLPDRLANYHHRDRGGAGLYLNSVIGGASRHAEFDAIVRNKYLRQATESGANLGMLVNLGLTLGEIRGSAYRTEERSLASRPPEPVQSDDTHQKLLHLADSRWVALAGLMSNSVGAPGEIASLTRERDALTAELAQANARLQAAEAHADDRWIALSSLVAGGARPRRGLWGGQKSAAGALLGAVKAASGGRTSE